MHNKEDLRDYKEFYRKSMPFLISALKKLGVKRSEDLEELIQETYVEAFKSWHTVSKPPPLAWLAVIARRRFYRFLERTHNEPQNPVTDWQADGLEQETEWQAGSVANPYLLLEDRQRCTQVLQELAQLADERQRKALVAFFLHEQPLKEIAANQNLQISTVTTWIYRFRVNIKKILHQEDENPERKNSKLGQKPMPIVEES